MINVISCITLEHDLRLVALAAFICLAGGLTLIQLVRRAYQVKGRARIAWAAISSIALTVSVWCTHFISMLAFDAGVPVTIDPVLTMLSLLLPTFGFFIAICLNISKPTQLNAVLGNTLMGLCIATLHYVGMMAYRVDGLVSWKLEYIAASVALVCAFSILSGFAFLRYKESRFNIPATLLFAAGVVSVHFTGMEAMQIYPLQLSDAPMDAATFQALSIATAIGGILVIGLGLASFFLDHDTRQDNYQQLLKMAMTDSLTGLPNRNAFIEDLDRKIEKAHGLNKKLAVIVIDLNRFKEINDMYGHRAGDEVLSTLATSLIGELSADINIARMGGDEFAASVVYDKTATLDAFIARLESALNIQAMFEETLITTSGSFGVAKFPTDGQSSDELRNNADLAMYRAKLHPSRKVCFYEPSMDAEIRQKREIANALSHAMEHDQLELHYQLQASVQSGKVCGMEALLRWTHPTMGPVSPAVFIPIAEEYNLIIALGEWVLNRACRDAASWKDGQKVAVNLSPLQLMQVELPRIIHQNLIETGLAPHRLEVELTETAILSDRDRSLHILRQIKALGVCVALDDFGTGYSSLEILRAFPFDKIKLDRFFMTEIETSNASKAMVRSVLSLGKNLKIPVLAEGVETELQLDFLREEGCDEIQGFLLGRPEKLAEAIRNSVNTLAIQEPEDCEDDDKVYQATEFVNWARFAR